MLPLMTLLFLPIVLGMRTPLSLDARRIVVAHDEILQHKQPYLNTPFFLVRAAIYFAVWNGLVLLPQRLVARAGRTGDTRLVAADADAERGRPARLRPDHHLRVGRLGDVARRRTGSRRSTACSSSRPGPDGLALLDRRARRGSPPRAARRAASSPAHFHDLGKLLLAFVMLWAYFSFSQFLIIWSGNLPRGDPLVPGPAPDRLANGRRRCSSSCTSPCRSSLLLSRGVKRTGAPLEKVAIGILVVAPRSICSG